MSDARRIFRYAKYGFASLNKGLKEAKPCKVQRLTCGRKDLVGTSTLCLVVLWNQSCYNQTKSGVAPGVDPHILEAGLISASQTLRSQGHELDMFITYQSALSLRSRDVCEVGELSIVRSCDHLHFRTRIAPNYYHFICCAALVFELHTTLVPQSSGACLSLVAPCVARSLRHKLNSHYRQIRPQPIVFIMPSLSEASLLCLSPSYY